MTQFVLDRLAVAWKAIIAAVLPILIATVTDILTDFSEWSVTAVTAALGGVAVYAKANRTPQQGA